MSNTDRFVDYEPFERIIPAAIPFPRSRSQHPSDRKPAPPQRYNIDSFVGQSREANDVREALAKFSQIPLSNIVITGETGTGKGLAARILHNTGARAEGPLVEVNCAALPRELMESELFGHEAGAFTSAKNSHRGLMEQAHKGTLFLDEIGELDLELQAKLLKAIEDREIRRVGGERTIAIDVQIIAATNQDLLKLVDAKAFRADLYHRLSVFQLELPPLRVRKLDIEGLVDGLIPQFNAAAGKCVKRVPERVRAALEAHDWPGNIRELRNVVERSIFLSIGEDLPIEWLQIKQDRKPPPAADAADVISLKIDGSMSFDGMEQLIIEAALQCEGYNVVAAARRLGMTRETLRYRMGRHKIQKRR
jgi:transcriptional regulator with PAS, ATPase and Fis domain